MKPCAAWIDCAVSNAEEQQQQWEGAGLWAACCSAVCTVTRCARCFCCLVVGWGLFLRVCIFSYFFLIFFFFLLGFWNSQLVLKLSVTGGILLLSCGLRFLNSPSANESGCEQSSAGAAGTAWQCEHKGMVLNPSLPKDTAIQQVYSTATYSSGLHPELSPNSQHCCYISLLLFSCTGKQSVSTSPAVLCLLPIFCRYFVW